MMNFRIEVTPSDLKFCRGEYLELDNEIQKYLQSIQGFNQKKPIHICLIR